MYECTPKNFKKIIRESQAKLFFIVLAKNL